MNTFANPIRYKEDQDFMEAREFAYSVVNNWISQGRLLIKGVEHGKELSFAQTQIKKLRDQHGDDVDIVYIMDNLSKTVKEGQSADDAADYAMKTAMSEEFKDIAVINKICTIATVQYTKKKSFNKYSDGGAGETPDNRFLGTGQYRYDADIIMHLFNENIDNIASNRYWFADEYFNPISKTDTTTRKQALPIVDLFLSKNKRSEHTLKKIQLFAIPAQARYIECS
jgi:hypothetical protein